MGIHESGENYLETILLLSRKNGGVRSVDIVNELEISRPSVSKAMGILKNDGMILIDRSGFITLTDEGKAIAERIYERHRVLAELLVKIGVDEKTAAEDACKIEHDISDITFQCLKNHISNHR